MSLGKWSKWSDDGKVMHFTGGQSCWQGPARSARVTMTCGAQNRIFSADEPEVCNHVLEMESPAACSKEQIAELEGTVRSMLQIGHADL